MLNLLSTPIEQRDIFLDAFPNPDKRPEGEIYMLYGSSGAMFRRFDLTLPKGSKVKDIGRSGFEIDTARFSLCVAISYSGTSVSFSPEFAKFYLNKDFRSTQGRTVNIRISGRIKPLALLHASGWHYHDWLDSFRERLLRKTDFGGFLESINWSIVEPFIFATRTRYQRKVTDGPSAELGAENQRTSRVRKPKASPVTH